VLHHVSREPRAGDRGRAFGAAASGAVAHVISTYRRLLREAAGVELREAGPEVGARLDRARPELVLELEGIAAGARVDVLELLAVNARTELMAGRGAGECSLIARRAPGGAWLAQTWDWHPALASAAVAWTVVTKDGTWFTTVTEAGILGKLGLNGSGVACGLNFLTCSADGGLDGVPVHVLARLVLAECRSGADARELLGAARASASSCLTVAAADALFSAEVSPGGTRFVEPDADGRLVHTNHFLRAPAAGEDLQPARTPGTLARRSQLERRLREGWTPREALSEHTPEGEPVCRHGDAAGTPWAERRATLLAIWAEPAAGVLRVSPGNPCESAFVPVPWPELGLATP
jgi:isopenicillin-N N-acyltransferase-like protein